MKTKKTDHTDHAIETWRTALAARDATRKAHADAHRDAEAKRRPGYNLDAETRLGVIALHVAALEADDDEAAARAVAVAALAARDVASGDPDALACDAAGLHAEIVEGIAEIERRRAALADFERGLAARVDAARAAHGALATRRAAANLPEPARVPVASGFGELVALLETRIGSTPAPKHGEKIRALKREETELRASLEREHREKEAAKIRAKADAEQEARDHKARADRNAAENAALTAKYAAEAKAREDLANAHRARTA